eukprot:jgi/Chrpa1/16299/Chrysochromulina_OHIO_Genome00006652-RA
MPTASAMDGVRARRTSPLAKRARSRAQSPEACDASELSTMRAAPLLMSSGSRSCVSKKALRWLAVSARSAPDGKSTGKWLLLPASSMAPCTIACSGSLRCLKSATKRRADSKL